ncbi:MAG: SDR family NAD(P)-dependent oxidoreductase [Candidatus Elarobacter sp.]
MAKKLEGTIALVTGASSGIGAATALALAAEGAKVGLVARRLDRLQAQAKQIRELGSDAIALEADIAEPRHARAAIDDVVRAFGRLDIVVNNAGVMLLGPIGDADVAEWERMLDLNVRALMQCTHAALPHLKAAAKDGKRKVADLVNISSTAGRSARSGAGVYNATKFAVGAFSEALRQEVTKEYVRVSLVEPGMTATELREQNRPEIQEKLRADTLPHPLQAGDIADAIVYVVTRPAHVAINEVLIRPTEQER